MFNEEIAKVYDERTVEKMREYADKMEKAGRRAILCMPAKRVKGEVFPLCVGIDNWTEDDQEELYHMYTYITENRPFMDDDTELMRAVEYSFAETVLGGGIALWVK